MRRSSYIPNRIESCNSFFRSGYRVLKLAAHRCDPNNLHSRSTLISSLKAEEISSNDLCDENDKT